MCSIYLEGCAEVYAKDIVVEGNFELYVPDKMRAVITNKNNGDVNIDLQKIEKPTWEYDVAWENKMAPKLNLKPLEGF